MSDKAQQFCLNCGGELIGTDGEWLTCKYCGSRFENQSFQRRLQNMQELLNEINLEYVNNQRRNLYDAVHAKYVSTTEVRQYATEIKKHLPNDFQANFYLQATSGDVKEINDAIRGINVDANYDSLPPIIHFLIASLQTEYLLELNNLVERAYKKRDLKLFSQYATQISEEAEKVSDGVYATNIPRDVFIAYSSKDMEQVSTLCEELESQGISCFVAARNLRHGVGAVENYDAALKDAMDNCQCFVFVSSKNSRSFSCDAVTKEIPYIRSCDIANAPAHLRNSYKSIPDIYKKPRVEYRIGNAKATDAASQITDAFFEGHEWAYTPEAVSIRVAQLIYENPIAAPVVPEPTPVVTPSAPPVAPKQPRKKKSKAPVIVAIALLLAGAVAVGAWAVPKLANDPAKDTGEGTGSDIETSGSPNQNEGQQNQGNNNQNGTEINGPDTLSPGSLGLNYTVMGKNVCYVSGIGSCTDTDLVIPSTSPAGDAVVGIEEEAFSGCSKLTSVTIPDGVTYIGDRAFEGCTQMVWVDIPNSVARISDYAFRNCGIKTLSLPESITVIGREAFNWNSNLRQLDIPNGVTTIHEGAFSGCHSLEWVSIPSSVTEIDGNIFSNCSMLSSITVDSGNERYESPGNCLIDKSTKTLISGCQSSIIPKDGQVTSIGESAFFMLGLGDSISIPEGVVSIGANAFERCYFINGGSGALTLPASMKQIDPQALFGTPFESITVDPENTTYHCSGNCLIETESKKLIFGTAKSQIPDDGSVTSIGDYAFKDISALTSIHIPDGIISIGAQAFYSCGNLTTVTMADSVKSIGNRAFYECYKLDSIEFSDNLQSIGKEVFIRCQKLSSIVFPKSLEAIGERAISECDVLTSLSVDPSNTKLHSAGNCIIETATKTLVAGCADSVIPADGSVTVIGPYSFNNIDGLTSVVIPDGVTKIGNQAFSSCQNLTSITVPSSVTYIGESAFSWKTTDIYFAGTQKQWNNALEMSGYNLTDNTTVHFNSTN